MKNRPLNIVGPQIRAVRMRKKLSQSDLATKCQLIGYNISREGIAKIESKLRGLGDFELVGIAHVLDVDIITFFPSPSLPLAKECFLE